MSNSTISSLPAATSIDPVNDYLPIDTASPNATNKINRNTFLALSSQPLGLTDVQSPTNKTFNNTNVYTIKDSNFTLQNSSDTTKQAVFSLSSINTATVRTYTLPNASDTLAGISATQTLANKTFIDPAINGGTVSNATILSDAIAGFTSSNSGSIYGISVSSGVFTTAGIIGITGLQTNAVQGNQLATNAITLGYAQIILPDNLTGSSSFQDVNGLSVTVTVPNGGRRIKITGYSPGIKTDGIAASTLAFSIQEGSTCLGTTLVNEPVAAYNVVGFVQVVTTASAGSHTYKISVATSAGNFTVGAGSPSATQAGPAFILVEAI